LLTPVENNFIDGHTFSRIYAMQLKNWDDGQSIKVFVLPSNSQTHRQFTLKKNESFNRIN